MLFFTFDCLYVILIVMVLVKVWLSRANFTTLLTVLLGSSLSYCFFESIFSFFPLVFYFLKAPLECFFLSLKKSFASFKEFFSFTPNETKEKNVGADQSVEMKKSGNEAETSNPVSIEESGFDGKQGEGKVEEKEGVFVLKIRKEHMIYGAGMTIDPLEFLAHGTLAYRLAESFVKHSLPHLTACKDTATLRKYGALSTFGVWVGAYLFLYSSNKLTSGLKESLKRKVEALLENAISESQLPEKREQAEATREELGRTLNTHLFAKECVNGELLFVTNEQTMEFLSELVDDVCGVVKEDKFDVTLTDAQKLAQSDKELFAQTFKSVSLEDELSFRNKHPGFYRDIVLLAKSMVEPEQLHYDLIGLEHERWVIRQTESKRAQLGFIDELDYSRLARVKVGSLPHPTGSTLTEYANHIRTKPVSPGYSYDQLNLAPSDVKRYVEAAEKRAFDETQSFLKGLPSTSGQALESQRKLPGSQAGSSLQNPNSPGDPSWYSPLEKGIIEKDRHLTAFGVTLGVMLAICQACVGVLRKLRYTQEFAKTMTDKGWPRWLFFWISHSNPEPFPERSLFHLLICILVLNLVILYGLFSML